MPNDDQDFVGYFVSSIPTDVKKYSQEVADFSRDFAESVERHIDTVAASIRQTLQTTPWIPESIRPPAPPVRRTAPKLSLSYLDRVQNWVSRNPAVTAAVIAFLSTGTFIIWRRRKLSRQKRRARRAANGARTEVVILAGSPHSPLTKSIALDLERRGFIVYIPVSTLAEEQTVHSELRADIHPLNIDITSPVSTAHTIDKFSATLIHPPRHGYSSSHTLHLSAFIVVPSYPSTHPTDPIATLTPSLLSDTLNTHLIYPLGLLHAFLPLLLSKNQAREPPSTLSPPSPPTIILLSPSLPSSLHLPHHASESLTTAAIHSYLSTLRSEVSPNTLSITTIKLGSVTTASHPSRHQLALYRSARYGSSSPGPKSDSSSSPVLERGRAVEERERTVALRELHHGVFDAVVGRRRGTLYVGRGSWAYDFVGRWVPGGVVGWMMRRRGVGGWGEERGLDREKLAGSMEWDRVEEEGASG